MDRQREYAQNKEEGKSAIPEIILGAKEDHPHWPEGTAGEERKGFAFYRHVRKDGEEDQWEYITSEMGEKPSLSAVTEEQFEAWRKAEIIARPVLFRWNEETKRWVIERKNE